MMFFNSLGSFAAHLGAMAAGVHAHELTALHRVGRMVRTEARRVIGTYEYGWPPLAASTLEKKRADTPLLESGEMRESIQMTVQDHTAYVGSNNDKAVWQELGTLRGIPPRSFLAQAAIHKEKDVVNALYGDMVAYLTGGAVKGGPTRIV